MRHNYRFRVSPAPGSVTPGAGVYITDTPHPSDAQAELAERFQRPVLVWTPAEHDRLVIADREQKNARTELG